MPMTTLIAPSIGGLNEMLKFCKDCTDCVFKKSMFIGYVNKLTSNFRHLQTHVLITLFKVYCCSFYGSQLWKFNSVGIGKCCKSWTYLCAHY